MCLEKSTGYLPYVRPSDAAGEHFGSSRIEAEAFRLVALNLKLAFNFESGLAPCRSHEKCSAVLATCSTMNKHA